MTGSCTGTVNVVVPSGQINIVVNLAGATVTIYTPDTSYYVNARDPDTGDWGYWVDVPPVLMWTGTTDSNGVARDANGALPNLPYGTYNITASKTGYNPATASITVSSATVNIQLQLTFAAPVSIYSYGVSNGIAQVTLITGAGTAPGYGEVDFIYIVPSNCLAIDNPTGVLVAFYAVLPVAPIPIAPNNSQLFSVNIAQQIQYQRVAGIINYNHGTFQVYVVVTGNGSLINATPNPSGFSGLFIGNYTF